MASAIPSIGAAAESAKKTLSQLPARHSRRAAAGLTALSAVSTPAVAQSATGEAASTMCSTGLGPTLTFVFGGIALLLIIIAGARGALAFKNMGAAAPDKKREGRSQLKGAGITFAGAWFFPLFGAVLEQAGVATVSCVDWDSIIMVAPLAF